MKSSFDVVVIGAGVAGMTAAIYLKRANISVAIIESTAPGGQLNRINNIDNYPGVLSIDGPSLAFNVFSQMQELNVPYIYGNVVKIVKGKEYGIVTNKEEILCKSIIIATGRKPIETGLDIEKKLLGNGISYCSICDGNLYKDKIVAVYTNNEEGIEEAKYLSNICSKVYIVGVKGSNKNNIEYYDNKIDDIKEKDGRIESIILDNKNIKIDGLFVLLGSYPSTEFIDLKKHDDYIMVNQDMHTSEEGIYACGDVIFKGLYQVSTAVGEAATAANSAIKYINNRE
ncbi:MAG: FAD-dependent oxidoreductase [Tenericutes bacterium]|jgi:thioredoxin reductase (NADPH)|nr:FAD-dependent oxidoreductase [Bacilli bacterium]NLV90614.1 FAD-dependent oxidoreductase [Mycoplasmatota bacterium]